MYFHKYRVPHRFAYPRLELEAYVPCKAFIAWISHVYLWPMVYLFVEDNGLPIYMGQGFVRDSVCMFVETRAYLLVGDKGLPACRGQGFIGEKHLPACRE